MQIPRLYPMYLYRHFNEAGELLYVGISNNPIVRFELGHKKSCKNKVYWPALVKLTVVEQISGNVDELVFEAQVIKEEKPLYNFMHNRPPRLTTQQIDRQMRQERRAYLDALNKKLGIVP